MELKTVCGCCRQHPCGRGARYFAVGDWAGLERHLESSIQVNRPYPEQERTARPFATLGEVARRASR